MKSFFLLIICSFISLFLFDCQGSQIHPEAEGHENTKKTSFLDRLFEKPPLCPEAEGYKEEKKLEQAVNAYEACMNKSMSKKKQQQIQKDIDLLKTEIVSNCLAEAALVFKGGQTIAIYEKAIYILNAKKQYDRGNAISARLADYSRQKENLRKQINKFLETAELEAAKARWGDAVQSVGQALKLDPDDSSIASRLAGLIEERNAYYEQQIRSLCNSNDYSGASKTLENFRQEQPAPSDMVLKSMELLINETKEKVVRSEVERSIADKKYFTAYSRIQDTEVKNCKDLLEDAQLKGIEFYKNLAYKEKTSVNNFHAYIVAVKAEKLNPNDNEIFKLHQDMRDIVNDSIQIKIGVAEFKAPPAEQGAGREFSGMLTSRLQESLPYGVKIDEPEKIKFKEDSKLGIQAVEIIIELGQALGVFGDVSTLEVIPNISEWKNIAKVPIEKEIQNPQYQIQYQEMKKRYGSDKSKWPSIPPLTIKESTIQLVEYTCGKKRLEGRMIASARLYSSELNALIASQTFTVQLEHTDTYQDGVPAAGIQADPVELPSELQMKQELKQAMVEKVSKWILEHDLALNLGFFQLRQKYYYEKAKHFIERKEDNEAVKVLAQGYLYCLRDNIPENDEWFQKIRQKVLYELTE